MIVWLNGPFGIGKSTTAAARVRRLPLATEGRSPDESAAEIVERVLRGA